MYEYLKGILIEKSPTRAVIDVQGVGYDVRIPVSTFSKLPALGDPVKLLAHLIVREDLEQIYGFYTYEERDLFRLLISISGIGPKLGVTMLSGMTVQELKQAIIQGAVPTLTTIPGIGRKIAERVVVQLREKVALEEANLSLTSSTSNQDEAIMNDSIRALLELGYKKQDSRTALQKAWKELETGGAKPSISELVRKSLKYV